MARFTFMHIEFFVKPCKKELIRINKLFSILDYDFTGFNENGFYGAWRKPLLSVEEISNLLHCYGYPNKFRYVEDIYNKADKIENALIEEEYTRHIHKSYEEYAEELMCDWKNSKPNMIQKKIKCNRFITKSHQYNIVKKFSRRFV